MKSIYAYDAHLFPKIKRGNDLFDGLGGAVLTERALEEFRHQGGKALATTGCELHRGFFNLLFQSEIGFLQIFGNFGPPFRHTPIMRTIGGFARVIFHDLFLTFNLPEAYFIRMAKVKTNLTIDRRIKTKAVAYAKRRGKSLSDLVQDLLEREVNSTRARELMTSEEKE